VTRSCRRDRELGQHLATVELRSSVTIVAMTIASLRPPACPRRAHLRRVCGAPWCSSSGRSAQHELSLENYSTRPTGDNANQMGTVCGRHKVDYRRSAGSGLKLGFENESIGTIFPAHYDLRVFWCDEPPSIIDRPKESGEACGRIEARPAQPIDRAVAANQSRSPAVANKCIVFDAKRHCPSLL